MLYIGGIFMQKIKKIEWLLKIVSPVWSSAIQPYSKSKISEKKVSSLFSKKRFWQTVFCILYLGIQASFYANTTLAPDFYIIFYLAKYPKKASITVFLRHTLSWVFKGYLKRLERAPSWIYLVRLTHGKVFKSHFESKFDN